MPRLPAISPLPPLQQVIPPCRRLPRSSPRSSARTAHRRRLAFIGLGRFLPPHQPRGASATELSAQAPSGLLGPTGFASDGNAKTFTSPLCMLMAELGVQAPSGLLGPAGFAADGGAEIFTSQLLAFGTRLGTRAPSGLKAASLRTATPRSSPPRRARSGPSSARRRRVASWTRPASPRTATPSSPPPSCSRSRPGSGASDCDRASVGTAPSGRCCRVHGAGLLIALGGLSRGVRAPAAHAAYFLVFGICVVWVAARVALSLSSSPRAFPCVTGHPHGRAPHVRHQRPGPSSLSSRMVLSPSSSSDDGLLPSWRAFRPRASAAGRLHLRLRGRSSA